jgi:hypothetical protein
VSDGGETLPSDEAASDDPARTDMGRLLVDNVDGTVRLESELRLICTTEGGEIDHVVRRVTTFAFAVAAVVGTLALARIAPRPVGLFAATWVVAAIVARGWSTRRLREHGRFTFDFDRGVVIVENPNGRFEEPLDAEVAIERTDDETPGEHARWLLLRRRTLLLRIARGTPEELGRVLFVLRKQGLRAPTG